MNQEISEALEKKFAAVDQLTGVIILRNGSTEFESYFNGCTAQSRLHVYSVTKSIVSLLIGIALQEGAIRSLDQKVLEFFPEYTVKCGGGSIREVTLKQLLTMTAPYRFLIPPYKKYFMSEDWVTFTLDRLGGRQKPGKFRYMPLIGPDLLTGILIRATGRPVLDYAAEHLFTPLGIEVERSITFATQQEQMDFSQSTVISGWAADPQGVQAGGWGLSLTARDMARIGQLTLDRGAFGTRQLIPAQWIEESTREHSRWEKNGLPFGYCWWVDPEPGRGWAAMGDGGNVIYVNPDLRLVVAIHALYKPNVTDRLELIKNVIEPCFNQASESGKLEG